MAAPTIRGIGTVNSGTTGAVTYALPAHQVYDLLFLMVETNDSATLVVPTGWAHLVNSPRVGTTGVTATNTTMSFMWKRALSSAETNPVVNALPDHQVGLAVSVAGAISSGTPSLTSVSAPAGSASVTITPTATTVADNLILHAFAAATDTLVNQYSAFANATLTSVTLHVQTATDSGNGGVMMFGTGVKAVAGTNGATTATLATSAPQANMSLSLPPGTPGGVGSSTTGAYDYSGGTTTGFSANIKQGSTTQAYDFSAGTTFGEAIPYGTLTGGVDWSQGSTTGVAGIPPMNFGTSVPGAVDWTGRANRNASSGGVDYSGSISGITATIGVFVHGVGTSTVGTTTPTTYPLPVHAADDVLLLVVESSDVSGLDAPTGWEHLPGSPYASTGTVGRDTTLHVFGKRATSSSETDPQVPASADHQIGYAFSVSGVRPAAAGPPWRTPSVETSNVALNSIGPIIDTADSLAVWVVTCGVDDAAGNFGSVQNNPFGVGRLTHFVVTKAATATGDGGEYIVATAQAPFLGSTGSLFAVKTIVGNSHSLMQFALVPPAAVGMGSATGLYNFTGNGLVAKTGGATGGYDYSTGTTIGTADWAGTATGAYDYSTGTTTGTADQAGTATGTCDFSGDASGLIDQAGTASGAYDFTGTATGVVINGASSFGAYDFTGLATGATPTQGDATGAYDFTGSATGTTPVVVPPPTTYSAIILADGPIAYYRLNDVGSGTMLDSTGHGNNGLYFNDVTSATSLLGADTDAAARFNGGAGGAPGSPFNHGSAFSVEALFKPQAIGGTQTIVCRHSSGGSSPFIVRLQDQWIYFYAKFDGDFVAAAASVSVSNDTSHHVICTYDNAVMSVYLDGALVGTTNRTGPANEGADQFDVGSSHTGGGGGQTESFVGIIDEVSFYNYTLAPAKVTSHYNAAVATSDTKAGSATAVYDFSGSGSGVIDTFGTSTGAYDFTGSSTGAEDLAGTATGTLDWTGTSVGTNTGTGAGAATGTYDWTGTATGSTTEAGVATGVLDWAGTASGVTVKAGTSLGVYDYLGTAAGVLPTVRVGTSTGTYRLAGAAAGRWPRVASTRWTLYDPATAETFTFPINPNAMTPIVVRRELRHVRGRYGVVSSQLPKRAESLDFSGVIRSQAFYDALVTWANKTHAVLLTDHVGRQFRVYITDFQPTDRRPIPRAPTRWRYTVKTTLLAGPL